LENFEAMTGALKELLSKYGMLYITIARLEQERSGSAYSSLEEYYEALGDAEDGEPALVVRISKDGETRFIRDWPDPNAFGKKYERAKITVWELPEDEFYFFKAFRPAAFDLEKQLPSFIIEMAFVYSYEAFEGYLAEIVRFRLTALLAASDVDRKLDRILRSPIAKILDELRHKIGLRDLPLTFDKAIVRLSLMRNCLLHNSGIPDAKLAMHDPLSFGSGERIEVTKDTISIAISELRKAALAVDTSFERLGARS
jgi:hypothetical protein